MNRFDPSLAVAMLILSLGCRPEAITGSTPPDRAVPPVTSVALLAVELSGQLTIQREGTYFYQARPSGGSGVLLVTIPLIGVWPLWTGAVIKSPMEGRPGDRSSLPPDWRRVATTINTSESHGKTLVLPIDDYYQLPTTWGYYGADNLVRRLVTRPVIQSNPQLYVGDSAVFEQLMHSVEDAVTLNDGKGARPISRH